MRRRDTRPTDGPDVLRVRVALKLAATQEGGAYLRREADAYGTSVDGLLDAALAAAPDDAVLASLVASRRQT